MTYVLSMMFLLLSYPVSHIQAEEIRPLYDVWPIIGACIAVLSYVSVRKAERDSGDGQERASLFFRLHLAVGLVSALLFIVRLK